MFHQSIVRVRAGRKASRGNPDLTTLDWSPGAVNRQVFGGVSVQPTSQAEQSDETRTAVISGLQVISAPGVDVDVTAVDRIEWGGDTYEVEGEVGRYQGFLDGSTHHVEFVMRRVTG